MTSISVYKLQNESLDKYILESINMNKIMEKMLIGNKLGSGNLVMGYRLFSSRLNNSALMDIHKKLNNKTSKLIKANVKKINALDWKSMDLIHKMYTTHPKFVASSKCIVEKLFRIPFNLTIINKKEGKGEANNNSQNYLEITEELKEKLIKNHWLPFLIEHHHWISKFGVCPFYFEPLILASSSNEKSYTIHYFPKTPLYENGYILTFLDNTNQQSFIWKEKDYLSSSSWSRLGVESFDSFSSSKKDSTRKKGGGGGEGEGGDSLKASIDGSIAINKKIYKLKESRYMMFSVSKNKTPTLEGKILGEIASIIPEIELLNKMRAHQMIAGEKLIHPNQYIENPVPNMQQMGPSEIDKAKLVLELEKVRRLGTKGTIPEFSTVFGVPTPFQMSGNLNVDDLYREIPETSFERLSNALNTSSASELFQTKERYNSTINNLESIKNKYLAGGNSLSPTEESLGIQFTDDERYFTMYQSHIYKKPVDKDTEEMMELTVKAMNNPTGIEAQILETLKKMKEETENKSPPNAKYLMTGQKIVHGTNPSFPGYDIKLQEEKIESMINDICDFKSFGKSEMMNGIKTSEGTKIFGNLLKISFKSLVDNNAQFIKCLWELLLHVYVSNLIDDSDDDDNDKQRNELQKDISVQKLTSYNIGLLKETQLKVTVDFLDFTNDIFYEPQEYQELYKMGFLDEEQYYELMSASYPFLKNKPFSNQIKKRIIEKATEMKSTDELTSSSSREEKEPKKKRKQTDNQEEENKSSKKLKH